jgi:hypothetical protein
MTASPQNDNSFAIAGGGGRDVILNKHVSIRLMDVEVINSQAAARKYTANAILTANNFPDAFGRYTPSVSENQDSRTNNLKLSFGVVFHFGYKQE